MKLRLDYFKSIGGKVAKGDTVTDLGSRVVELSNHILVDPYNLVSYLDDKHFIESFAPRKNTGEQPCGDDMPVLVEYSVSECLDGEAHKAFMCEWDLNDGCIKSWKYDLESLIKMQTEHDAKKVEPVKSRVKVEYVKVRFSKLSDAFREHEESPLYICDKGQYHKANGRWIYNIVEAGEWFSLYRKVETEITWQDELKECLNSSEVGIGKLNLTMFESISSHSVESEEFIKMCHLVSSLNK